MREQLLAKDDDALKYPVILDEVQKVPQILDEVHWLMENRGLRFILFGKAFEHFIFMEIAAHKSYSELDYEINFWRTKSGMEVDFVLGGGEVAIEVKCTYRVDRRDLRYARTKLLLSFKL